MTSPFILTHHDEILPYDKKGRSDTSGESSDTHLSPVDPHEAWSTFQFVRRGSHADEGHSVTAAGGLQTVVVRDRRVLLQRDGTVENIIGVSAALEPWNRIGYFNKLPPKL